jgi:hypothetical protein
MDSKLDNTYKVRFNVRPIKHAYFIPSGDLAQLRNAISYSCTRGFHIACENCTTFNWYSIGIASEQVKCPGCGFEFVLPVEGLPG